MTRMMSSGRWSAWGIPAILSGLFLLVLPMFGGSFYLHLFIVVFLNITLAMGYRLLYVTGLCSFCHVTFYALGAYSSALLTLKLGFPSGLSFLVAGLIAAVAATLLMLPTAKVKGVYFFLVSFGFFGVLDSIFKYWRNMTGGQTGVRGIPPLMGVEGITSNYYLVLVFTVLAIFIMYRLDKTRFGAELIAIGEADDLAEVTGVNVVKHRILAFAIGALFAGFAGSMYAHYTSFVAPTTFSLWFNIYILIWCVVGGARKVWGPMAGAILMTFIAEFLRMSGLMQTLLYAVSLLAVIMAMPHGIVGLVDAVKVKLGRRPYPVSYARLGAESLPSVSALPNMTNRGDGNDNPGSS